MGITIADDEGLWPAVVDALSGGAAVAPAGPDVARVAALVRPESPLDHPDAAAIVATSGSTGDPKAVVLTRAALLASAAATLARLGGTGTWTSALPLHYVAGLMTMVRAFHAGTTPRQAPSDLSALPLAPGRNYLSIVPAQLHRGLDDPACVARLAAFDAVLVGGAAASDALVADARGRGISVVATYGMAESCGGCVYDGVPLDGVTVTPDADGRLLIASPTLFVGYRLRPELTAQVLVGGHFRSEDRGVFENGRLRVLGRLDEVVIVGGANVDLAHLRRITAELFGPPEAGGPLLVAVPDERWGVRIVAVSTAGPTLDDLRGALAGRVPSAALPRAHVAVEVLPVTATGKIDLRAAARIAREG